MARHLTGTPEIQTFLRPQARFFRSVSLERDLRDPTAVASYVVTPWLRTLIERVLSGVEAGSTRRAWRLTGDFGVGKSALALALAHYLDPRTRSHAQHVAGEDRALARLFPVVLMGSRDGLSDALVRCVEEALNATSGLGIKSSERHTLLQLLRTDPARGCEQLSRLVTRCGRFDGAFLLIDELGKLLEHAAQTGSDIFALQALAEAAARSGPVPFVVLTILHQGLTSYAEAAGPTARSEWAKVAERFEELNFDHPLTHTAALVGAALDADVRTLPAAVQKAYLRACKNIAQVSWLDADSLAHCLPTYPLHPSLLAIAPRFFSVFGQNERSLFGFLASEEPFGVRAFARREAAPGALYRLDDFFDFVAGTFSGRVIGRNAGADWHRIQSIVFRAKDQPALETRILKIVGLLTLIDSDHLVADEASLAACLGPDLPREEIEAAVVVLKAAGLLFERVGIAGLRLWAARRVDMNTLWAEAENALPRLESLSEALALLAPRRPVLARRHSIQTGTLRHFNLVYLPYGRLPSMNLEVEGDGTVLVIFADSPVDQVCAENWGLRVSAQDRRLVVVVPDGLERLSSVVLDLRRAQWLEQHAAVLRDDPFAAAELTRQVAWAEARINEEVTAALRWLGPNGTSSIVIWDGRKLPEEALHGSISRICDAVYDDGPRVQNELVNRHVLSSAAAAARQRLIEAMLDRWDQPGLGLPIDKSPPERALYLSILERGRLHVESGHWRLAVPAAGREADPLHLRPVLSHLIGRLRSTDERLDAETLLSELAVPPYGVREGLSLLLLGFVLALHQEHVAIYERGTFLPKVDGSTFLRLAKSPNLFAFQWTEVEGLRAAVFDRLARMLSGGVQGEGLLSVVRPLVQFGATLPFHTLKTQQLSSRTLNVRAALASANSPLDILFRDLPIACDCKPFARGVEADDTQVDVFVDRLEEAISELRAAYPTFIHRLKTNLFAALSPECPAVRSDLAARAQGMLFRLHEQRLRTFAKRLADASRSEDSWIEALAGSVVGKTPNRWLDGDEAIWRGQLSDLAGQFMRAEALHFTDGGASTPAVRLGLTMTGGREVMKVIPLPEVDSPAGVFAQSVADAIRAQGNSAGILALLTTLLLQGASDDEEIMKEATQDL
jgi:hypothetical protein